MKFTACYSYLEPNLVFWKALKKNINLIFFLVGSHGVRFGQRALLTFLLLINAQVQTLKHPKFYFVISIEKQSVSS